MRLVLERVSAQRSDNEYGIFDEVTDKCVGTVSIERAPRVGNIAGRLGLKPSAHTPTFCASGLVTRQVS